MGALFVHIVVLLSEVRQAPRLGSNLVPGGILAFEEEVTAEAWPFEVWWVARCTLDVRHDFDHVCGWFDSRIRHLR